MGNTLYSRKVTVQGLARITRYLVHWQLHTQARRHHESGFPQMAIFSHDHIGHVINVEGRYEEDYLQTVFGWLQQSFGTMKDQVALDIGANIGNHSVFFSKFFRVVYAFEPNPRTFALLSFNAGAAGNVVPHELGLSDADNIGSICENPTNIGGTYVALNAGEGPSITLCTLDKFVEVHQIADIGLIKIDTEGFEARVLRGASDVIRTQKPIIIFELSPTDFSDAGDSEVVSILKAHGYRFVSVEKNLPLGSSFLARMFSYALRTVVGERFLINQITAFKPKFYQMVAAVHDDYWKQRQ